MEERSEVHEHLIALRLILLRESVTALARTVENILAILDERYVGSVQEAKKEWGALLRFPRGILDFGIWREDYGERLRLNAEFEGHIQAINEVLK